MSRLCSAEEPDQSSGTLSQETLCRLTVSTRLRLPAAITDAKADGQPSPASSTRAVGRARTKLPSTSEAGVGGELVPCNAGDERSLTLRNTVADPDYVAARPCPNGTASHPSHPCDIWLGYGVLA